MPPEIVGVVSNEEFVDEDDLLPSTLASDAAEQAAVFVQKGPDDKSHSTLSRPSEANW